MNIKKLFIIISVFMILLGCVSCIYALSEDSMNDCVSVVDSSDESVSVNVDEQIMSVEDCTSSIRENDADSSKGDSVVVEVLTTNEEGNNFTSLQNLINTNDEISLNKDYARVIGEESIVINKNVTIIGNNHTIDANNLGGIFKINAVGTLTLSDVTLVNGVSDKGGAIYNSGELSVSDSKFIENTATYKGGAIYSEGRKLTINDCTFDSNNITCREIEAWIPVSQLPNYGGAAIYNVNGTLTVNNSKIINNLNGLVFVRGDRVDTNYILAAITTFSETFIDNSLFVNNAGAFGGAISAYKSSNNYALSVSNSKFERNNASAGGAIYSENNVLIVDACNFNENMNVGENILKGHAGGAAILVSSKNAQIMISKSNFTKNYGDLISGGVITLDYYSNNLEIDDCNFKNNTGSINSPVINSNGDTIVKNSTFSDTTGSMVIYLREGNASIYDSNFINNNVEDTVISSYNLCLFNSKFMGNKVSTSSTFWYNGILRLQGEATIVDSIFDNNTVQKGGAIYLENGSVTVLSSNFTNNNVLDGGAVYINSGIMNLADSYFENNTATRYGGAIYINSGMMNLTGSYFENNLAGSGDAIYNLGELNMADNENLYDEDIKNKGTIKFIPTLNVNAHVDERGCIIITATINKGATGSVTYKILNSSDIQVANKTASIKKGVIEEFSQLTPFNKGLYTILVEYGGNDDYCSKTVDTYVNVTKEIPILDVNASVNKFGMIIVDAAVDNATGNVTLLFTNVDTGKRFDVTLELVDGKARYDDITSYEKGTYQVYVTYTGDDNHYKTSDIKSVNITKDIPTVNDIVVVIGNQATITLKFPANADGNVTVYYLTSGSNATFTIKNGEVVINEIFDNGNQSMLVAYDGDDKYYGLFDWYVDFYVKATSFISVKDVSVVYNNNAKVTVKLTDNNDKKGQNPIANAEVIITVNGKNFKGTTDSNGNAVIMIPANFVPKIYDAKVTYAGTKTCHGETVAFKLTVKKEDVKLTAKKKTFKAKTKTKKYTITLKDNKGKVMKKAKVTLKVKGKTYKATTNANGKATFKIKNLNKKGKYNAKITFGGNSYFNKKAVNVKLTVKK